MSPRRWRSRPRPVGIGGPASVSTTPVVCRCLGSAPRGRTRAVRIRPLAIPATTMWSTATATDSANATTKASGPTCSEGGWRVSGVKIGTAARDWRTGREFAAREYYRDVDNCTVELSLVHMRNCGLGISLIGIQDIRCATVGVDCSPSQLRASKPGRRWEPGASGTGRGRVGTTHIDGSLGDQDHESDRTCRRSPKGALRSRSWSVARRPPASVSAAIVVGSLRG